MMPEDKTSALMEELRKRGYVIIPLALAVSIKIDLESIAPNVHPNDLSKLKSSIDATQEEIRK